MRNMHVTIGPDHWTGPEPGGDLEGQVLPETIQPETDEQGRETGWVTGSCWRHLPGEPGPEYVRVRIRASVLPEPS